MSNDQSELIQLSMTQRNGTVIASNGYSNSEDMKKVTRKRSAADFQFLECIGEGSYSKVYRAVSRTNVHTYAIKVLNKQHIHKEKKKKYVTIEKNTLNMLGVHPGIVTLYYTFQDPKNLYFVIDYASNGELLNLIHRLGSLSLELSLYYTVQLVDTIAFIHDKGIIHRDLKPENILLSKDWKLMITDFGAAKFYDCNDNLASETDLSIITTYEDDKRCTNEIDGTSNDHIDSTSSNGSFVGTAEYISPELLKYNQSSFASDYWSLGCIIYQMFVGRPPFKATNEYETFEKIVEVNYTFPEPSKYPIPSYVVDLIRCLLIADPNKRLGVEGIKSHKWFQNINWNDKNAIWGLVPKLEPYKPENHFKLKQMTPISNQRIGSPVSIKKNAPPTTTKKASGNLNELNVGNKRKNILKEQLLTAQNNTSLMNKVLTNRIDEKDFAIGQRLINSKSTNSFNITTTKPNYINTNLKPKSPKSSNNQIFQTANGKMVVKNNENIRNITPTKIYKQQPSSAKVGITVPPPIKNESTSKPPPRNDISLKRNSGSSFSSMLTNGESSKSVIITKQSTPTIPETSTIPAAQKINHTSFKNITSLEKKVVVKKAPLSPDLKLSYTQKSAMMNNKMKPKPSIASNKSLNELVLPKPRVASSDAAAAAGAIGKMLTHKRTSGKFPEQLVNPILMDKQIPSVITNKLMQQETILKLDNIFKSEISHKGNPAKTLNHSILESIITKHERELDKNLKSCIMVITSHARVFIYELNDGFHLNTPQSATQMQARDFYNRIIEVKLTNKNVSLYDYEFDEELHEGYLILELANINKLICLSAWDRSKFVKGGLNSNVRVGFRVNSNETWVKTFLRAKELLKRKEVKRNAIKGEPIENNKPSGGTNSLGIQQSFMKLKINTQGRLRSFSTTSKGEEGDNSRRITKRPSMQSIK